MMAPASKAAIDERRLVFKVGDMHHAIEAGRVLEVIKAAILTRVPNGPPALAGIAGLRGQPIPVLSMRAFINAEDRSVSRLGKIIVYDHGRPVGLLVDDVLRLTLDDAAVLLQGMDERIAAAFRNTRQASPRQQMSRREEVATETGSSLIALLSFRICGQLYGLPLEDVREVIKVQAEAFSSAGASPAVVGLMAMRDAVLPLISTASLLGLDAGQAGADMAHVIVVAYEGDAVGLVVDEIDAIRRLPEDAIDPVPAVLQKGRGDAQIEAIGRLSQQGKLISILSPKKLFGHQAVAQAVSGNAGAGPMNTTPAKQEAVEQFLIFHLGEEIYGLPIAAVDEVIRVPGAVTRMPGAPDFVRGVINLRGNAVVLIDQGSRFAAGQSRDSDRKRAIIVTLGKLQAGFVVDGVSEVKAIAAAALSEAPAFSSEETSVFDRIARIESDGRMVLLIDAQALLSKAEQDVVAALTKGTPSRAAP